MRCSTLRDDKHGEADDQNKLDHAGPTIERQGASDVGGCGVRASIAHPVIFSQLAVVTARSGDFQIQCARHRRFRPSCVGRFVMPRVVHDGAERRAGIAASRGHCGEQDEQGCEARGRQVHDIVEPRRRPAISEVAFAFVADHAVGCIDGFIEHTAREAAHSEPKNGRNNAVGKILSKAFDSCARNAMCVEGIGVAADDHRNGLASGFNTFSIKRFSDSADVFVQAALSNESAGEDGEHCHPDRIRQKQCDCLYGQRDAANNGKQDDKSEYTIGVSMGEAVFLAVEPSVETRDQRADPCDGMAYRTVKRLRIAARGFYGDGKCDNDQRRGEGHEEPK